MLRSKPETLFVNINQHNFKINTFKFENIMMLFNFKLAI